MNKSALTLPKLRFKGFDGGWERKKLGNISSIKTGSKDLKDKDDNGRFPFFVRSDKIEKINSYSFDGEAILIPGDGKIGEIYHYINGKFDYHQRVYKISNTIENLKFIYFLFQKNIKKYLLSFSAKATVDSIRLPMLLNFPISLPPLQEQQKIAHFFSLLDKQIQLWERKLELYELKRKYYLNILLEVVNNLPKWRFKEFNDEWAFKKIGNIFNVTRGFVLSKEKITNVKSQKNIYPVYSSQTLNNGLLGYYDKWIYENAITWTTDGANAGTINFRKEKFYCTNVCGVLLEKEVNPNLCISLILSKQSKKYVVKELGNPKLMNNVMENIFICIPSPMEQQKISLFISKLNNQIKKIKFIKSLLNNKKRFYINKLFI